MKSFIFIFIIFLFFGCDKEMQQYVGKTIPKDLNVDPKKDLPQFGVQISPAAQMSKGVAVQSVLMLNVSDKAMKGSQVQTRVQINRK